MKLTIGILRKIIKEEVKKSMKRSTLRESRFGDSDYAIELDISDELFRKAPRMGDDVTQLLAQASRNLRGLPGLPPGTVATVVNPSGPGGGNPVVQISFTDEEVAWEWFSVWQDTDDLGDLHALEVQ
jgi:hypothetical protein